MKTYTIKELQNNNNVVIYLENRQQHKQLTNEKELHLCEFQGAYCYSHVEKTYSITSSKTNSGSYKKNIIYFNQIDFQDNPLNNLIIW